MSKDELIEAVRQRARKNYSRGYNCAECVTEAVFTLMDTGMPVAVKKVATGFGGGIGLFGDTCGALAGAVMAVSAVHGREDLPDGADIREQAMKSKALLYGNPGMYRIFNQIPNRFIANHGNTLCRELTKPWQSCWLCKEHAYFCRDVITDAAGIAAEMILTDKNNLAKMPFGNNVENLKD